MKQSALPTFALPGIDFMDVPDVFDGDTVTVEDDRYDYAEQRFCKKGN